MLSAELITGIWSLREDFKDDARVIFLVTRRENWAYFDKPDWKSRNVKLLTRFACPTTLEEQTRILTRCLFWDAMQSSRALMQTIDETFQATWFERGHCKYKTKAN